MAGYRPPYTWTEEKAIVDYIIENSAHYRTKGDALWKEMAASENFERTWQSMKQHFRKKMIFELNRDYYALSKKDAANLKKAFDDTARTKQLSSESSDSEVETTSSHKPTQNNDETQSSSKRTQKKVSKPSGKKKLKDLDGKETPNFLEIDFDSDETD